MSLSRLGRPASIALALGASALLLLGFAVPGVVVGALAVMAAWLRPTAAGSREPTSEQAPSD